MSQRISENLENDNGKTNCRKCGHSLCASNEKARELLGWNPKRTLYEMVESTYDAYED